MFECNALLLSLFSSSTIRLRLQNETADGGRRMKIIELFAGSCDFAKLAKSRGHEVFTIDIKQFGDIDLLKDIEFLELKDLPFRPDLIIASPTCTTYSIAAISHHRNLQKPKSEFASKSDRVVENMFKLIDQLKCIYFVENPRGMFRKMDFVQDRNRKTVSYCSYGDIRMKPTDIFTNSLLWNPKPICKNYKYDIDGNIINRHCHHESARRGAKTGTQGLKNNFERSRIPKRLHLEILLSVEKELMS